MILLNELTGQAVDVSEEFFEKATADTAPNVVRQVAEGKFTGFVSDLNPEAYHSAHAYYSNSFLTEVRRSPAHALARRLNPERTPALEFGEWFHMAVLERDRFEAKFICGPSGVTRAAKEWKAFLAEHPGKTVLKPDEWDQIRRMVDAVVRNPSAEKLLHSGEAEASFFWVDPETGLKRKARADYLRTKSGIIVDLKTTTDASFRGFQRSVHKYGYAMQSAGYLDGFNLLTGQKTNSFVHLCVEKEPPYGVAVYVLDDATLDLGRALNRKQLMKVLDCEISGEWGGYPSGIQAMNAPYFDDDGE